MRLNESLFLFHFCLHCNLSKDLGWAHFKGDEGWVEKSQRNCAGQATVCSHDHWSRFDNEKGVGPFPRRLVVGFVPDRGAKWPSGQGWGLKKVTKNRQPFLRFNGFTGQLNWKYQDISRSWNDWTLVATCYNNDMLKWTGTTLLLVCVKENAEFQACCLHLSWPHFLRSHHSVTKVGRCGRLHLSSLFCRLAVVWRWYTYRRISFNRNSWNLHIVI